MMITQFDFLLMDVSEQAEATWKGDFLGDRSEGNYRIQLFSLGSFYVEVFYNVANNEIERFASFTNVSGVVPYLNLDNMSK